MLKALQDMAMFGRYASSLGRFLRKPLNAAEAETIIRRSLASRNRNFLALLRRGVLENPRSPYARLLRHAAIEFGDVERLVRQDGLEAALGKLYDAGIYVTSDEFKGRKPIRRAGLEFAVQSGDFSNPLLARHYEVQTSGSRGVARRIVIDLDLLVQEASYVRQFMSGFGLWGRPVGCWRAVPPVSSGIKVVLDQVKNGNPVRRWFSQNRFDRSLKGIPFFVFTAYTIFTARMLGSSIPNPTYVSREQVERIVRWLVEQVRRGRPAFFDTNASSAVRICHDAQRRGLDLSGTFFRAGGEPLTVAKARAVRAVGASIACHYSMAEVGHIGVACAGPKSPNLEAGEESPDDVHIESDKMAIIQRPKSVGGRGGPVVDALIHTTIHPACPMIMLNAESGDYGVLERRPCGCPLGRLGLDLHLRHIRSYEKLCSEGVTFLGTELLRLVEEVLPARFGGSPTDYQLVEEEESGLPRVSVLVNPRLGEISDEAVLDAVCRTLADCPGGENMVDQWNQGSTLRVIRRSAYATTSSKILPLHVLFKS